MRTAQVAIDFKKMLMLHVLIAYSSAKITYYSLPNVGIVFKVHFTGARTMSPCQIKEMSLFIDANGIGQVKTCKYILK